jgi:hypothetical protein
VAEDRQRNWGFLSTMVRGVSNPSEGSNILTFLFRSRLVRRARSYISEAREGEFFELRLYGVLGSSPTR